MGELVASRHEWVSERRKEGVEGVFRAQAIALPLPPSFHDAVRVPRAERAVIAGYMRRSPASDRQFEIDLAEFVRVAEHCGACAIAVYPDDAFHGGDYQDILAVAQETSLPVLSRDPVVDPLQIVMARAHGAAAVTIDVASVGDMELRALHKHAVDLGLDVLFDARSAADIDRISKLRVGMSESSGARVVGVVGEGDGVADLLLFERLAPAIPEHAARIATGGVDAPAVLLALDRYGYDAVLIAEPLLASDDVAATMRLFAGNPVGAL